MSTIAQGAVSHVGYVVESTWGSTPVTPELTSVPYTSFNINLTKSVYDDASIQPDRMSRYSIHGNRQVAGDIAVNMSANAYDTFLESLMNSTFNANVLKTGTTRKSLTIEQGSPDISQYSVYTGLVVDKMALTVPVDGVVTAQFSFIGKEMVVTGTPLDATLTPATAGQPFVHEGGVFSIGNQPANCTVTGIQMSVDNGYTANFSLGNTLACDLSFGMAKVTGSITVYFKDATLLNAFLNGTESSLEFTLTDGTDTHTYLLPRIKYNGASKSISGSGSVILTIPFVALYDSVTGTNLRITRA